LNQFSNDPIVMYNMAMDQAAIEQLLTRAFTPTYLQVTDESDQHRHHRGTSHTENTHFHVIVVSDAFTGQSLIHRHRRIHTALSEGFKNQLHALKITAKTPIEWGRS